MRAAAYLRVSTEGQCGEDKYGLADQRHDIEEYAKVQGLEIVEWYSDEGISGATLERPALQQILSDAGKKRCEVVLVAKMDRVARDLLAQLWIEKELLTHDVELISAKEPIRGQDPTNVLMRQIIGAFAQFEKSRITERLSGGRKQKARHGGYSGGGAPMGYKAERDSKKLHIDEGHAQTVRRVFELKEANPTATLQQMADMLNAEGSTTAKGARWQAMQVKRVLDKKDFYQGQYSYAGIQADGKHQPIL
ncbi:MAG: recombinase family protein [Caulobacteraceae bacterium]